MERTYEEAYTEVLEILKKLPKTEYEKIPKEKIQFFEKKCDNQYTFTIDANIPLNKQEISRKANAILVTIFRDYFATEKQKEVLKKILDDNLRKAEKIKAEKYNPDDIFKNKQIKKENNTKELVVYKKSFLLICVEKIKKLLKNIFNK